MHPDIELDTWRRHWQAPAGAVPVDLAARVERDTRRMRRVYAAEMALVLMYCGGSAAWAALSGRSDILALAIGIWTFTGIACAMSWLLRRGAWAPVASTTTAFLELSILRCRRRRESVAAQAVLYVMILAFDLIWIYFQRAKEGSITPLEFLTGPSLYWVWAMTAALGAVAVWYRRRLAREMANLIALGRQIDVGGTRML
jgi:hypothetical protein